MIRRTVLVLLLFIVSKSFASHIVGGEFELIYTGGNIYRLNLIIYFDVVNGNAGARDNQALVRIFRKSDNATMMDVNLPFISQTRVDYFQPECSTGEVVTDRLLYTTTIVLADDQYNDPEGYYITWERCCRNYTINNIYSENPQAGTRYAGQAFYLEFPAVVDSNGDTFVNSSPQLFPPLNDYACPNRPYWVDFAGTDIDDDSLVYTLVTPLNTITAAAIPNGGPRPGPYPEVQWRPGFGITNILGGNPDLAISTDGFLSVTPTKEGLYVFAVKCEEFREGTKIGELRRDFQLLVVDKCPVADPPVVRGGKLTDQGFVYTDEMVVTFPNTVSDAERCININVSDLDASKLSDNFVEEVFITATPINFKDDISALLPNITGATLINGSTKTFEMCFPECPFIDPLKSDYYELAVVVFDDACALPLTDSLYIKVFIEPPVNNEPYFANAKGGQHLNTITRTVEPTANGNIVIDINGYDDDGHNLSMAIFPDDFDPTAAGMVFTEPNLTRAMPTHSFPGILIVITTISILMKDAM